MGLLPGAATDLSITGNQTNLEIDIFRKPTTTDTINFSNHPIEKKMVAFRYYISRMHSLPLTPEKNKNNGR
jgi:hypothetical protein